MASGTITTADLLPYAQDADPDVRDYAVQWIADFGGTGAGHALVELLKDSEDFVRWDAAEGLGLLRYTPAADALSASLSSDPVAMVRVCAAEALGELSAVPPEAASALLRAVELDRSPLVRAYAAESLARLGVRDAEPVLRSMLGKEHNSRVRASFLAALSWFGDPMALRRLMQMADRVNDPTAICGMLQDLAGTMSQQELLAARQAVIRSSPEKHTRLDSCLAEAGISA